MKNKICLIVFFYNLPGNEKRNPKRDSKGRSHTLTACCLDPDDSVETKQSKDEIEMTWKLAS